MIAVYVINLDISTERLDLFKSQLDAFGIAFERVAAVDGRHLDLATVTELDVDRATAYMGRNLVGGELGCYYSHLAAASRFLASDAQYGLVLEDDALLRCNLKNLLAEVLPDLEIVDPDWLLINLGSGKKKLSTFLSRYCVDGHDCTLVAAHYYPMSTLGIV